MKLLRLILLPFAVVLYLFAFVVLAIAALVRIARGLKGGAL
jgi:hypothetical protein